MKRMVNVLIACILAIALAGCGGNSNAHEGEAKTPSGSSAQKGRGYQDVIDEFKEKGFKNIKTETLEDLITGWMTKDGEVKSVSVDGNEGYSPDAWYPNDVEVVITYHTFSKEKKSDTVSTDKASSKPVASSSVAPSTVSNQEILTVENNKDLAALLAVKNPADPIVSEFAKNYAGRTIEFDGNIAYMTNHGNNKTRYDFLICPGDYSETSAIGPNFKFEDVNIFDLHFTGSNIPENIIAGQNLHITATVKKYDEKGELFYLKPISTKIR